tara:strand:- start:21 stop:269 length:249 start_codon:yes stop_codon:yes gene_type:complete
MNIDKNKVLNANIKFTINELQHIIIALVMAKKASESLSSMEFSKSFDLIKKDLVKIKDNLIKKGESNGLLEKGRAPYCETCD